MHTTLASEANARESTGEEIQQDEWLSLQQGVTTAIVRSMPSSHAVLHCNTLSDLRSISLQLSQTKLAASPGDFSGLQHITRIKLWGDLPSHAIASLSCLPLLSHLDLRSCTLTLIDAELLSVAPSLEKLTLCAVPLPKDFLRSLAPTTSITRLSLFGCGLRSDEVEPPLVLYNTSVVHINFFALDKTSALAYHLSTLRDRVRSQEGDFIRKLLLLACSRAGRHPAPCLLTSLHTDLLVLIFSHFPAPSLARFPHQLTACARFLLTLPAANLAALLRAKRLALRE